MAQPNESTDMRAVIYVRGNDSVADRIAECGAYCGARGYRIVGAILGDPDGERWSEVAAMAQTRQIEVAVVHSRRDLPPERVPRIEIATEYELDPEKTQRIRLGPRRPRRLG